MLTINIITQRVTPSASSFSPLQTAPTAATRPSRMMMIMVGLRRAIRIVIIIVSATSADAADAAAVTARCDSGLGSSSHSSRYDVLWSLTVSVPAVVGRLVRSDDDAGC